MFSGDCVAVPAALRPGLETLRKAFDGTRYQDFGYRGSSGFFAARTITAGELVVGQEAQGCKNSPDDFLVALLDAVIRALPDGYGDGVRYVNWMLSRHASPVEAMPAHHDDVAWLAQLTIKRTKGVNGGAVQLLDKDGAVSAESLLLHPLDGYIIRDEHFRHAVTAMDMETGDDVRDILVFRISDVIAVDG